jgi:hypothetical protein
LGVLQAADPELFPNDTVVQELKAFDSLFYKALAMTVGWLSIVPEQVKSLLFICYVFYLFLLFLTLYALTNCITKNKWLFILISIWVIQPTHSPLGGGNLFEPILRHTEVAFLFGLWTIYGLLQKRYLLMWSCLAVALLVHALVGLHLLFVIGPAWLFFHRSSHWKQSAGLILFGLALIFYFQFMAPPTFSEEEAQLFIQAKSSINHISLLSQEPIGWVKVFILTSLSLIAFMTTDSKNKIYQHLAFFIICGAITAIAISALFLLTDSARLAQFQPMRIFAWQWFFVHLLWLAITVQQLTQRTEQGVLLLGAFILLFLDSLWGLALACFALVYLPGSSYLARYQTKWASYLETANSWSLLATAVFLAVGWLVAQWRDLSAYFLNNLTPIPILVGFSLLAWPAWQHRQAKQYLFTALISFALIQTSLFNYSRLAEVPDNGWEMVQRWSRESTAKEARFLTDPTIGRNFRIGAWRTSISEPMSALAWVAPYENRDLFTTVARVQNGYQDSAWNLAYLTALAQEQEVDYILLKEPITVDNQEPVFQAGSYAIFAVP